MNREKNLHDILERATPVSWGSPRRGVRLAAWALYFLVTINVGCMLAERLGIPLTPNCLRGEMKQ